ncbi:MAG: nitroreductase family protein [Syntrophomonadaceae bacterium]
MKDFFELMFKRYSCRAYQPHMVEDEKLNAILECARLAPTANNRQEFRVIVVRTAGREQDLHKIYGREWFVEAPYVLGVCSIPSKCWTRGDGKVYSDVDAAIVMDHMVLGATVLGLGTCWVANFNPEAAREILLLEPDWEPVAFTPLGYPRPSHHTKIRKRQEEIVVYR